MGILFRIELLMDGRSSAFDAEQFEPDRKGLHGAGEDQFYVAERGREFEVENASWFSRKKDEMKPTALVLRRIELKKNFAELVSELIYVFFDFLCRN